MPSLVERRTAVRSLALACAVLAAGCTGGDLARYDVSGRVTYRGQPVPAGTIIFEPDDSKGNEGPQGIAPIVQGRYDTSQGGKGTVGGPHRVTILGCDGVTISETSPQGKTLFEPYSTTAELPRAKGTVDFDVPAGGGSL